MGAKARLSLVAVMVVAAGLVGWRQSWRVWPPEPHVDQRLAAAALPVIDRHLQDGRAVVWRSSLPARLRPRWFCAEEPIEVQRQGSRIRVSLDAMCKDYAREGGDLVTRAGVRTPLLVTLDHGGEVPAVRHVARPVDGAGFRPSLERMFSARAIAEHDRRRRLGKGPDAPDAEAARAFGLPAGTRARPYDG
ncbi:hypothetical protein SAMN05443665_1002217 [Actinomadura meyerae]|uniref:Uncharacterized protein n=1 Tax=Actinomadura meyerae TaxID=240840 RepID=A0A239DBE7_9ACTN|nr:hypothetical protein [Actinomadura meyerae]SNS29685.1 hypothetical protein SAMN05443665_1002217 [Actinomadura meyerae]